MEVIDEKIFLQLAENTLINLADLLESSDDAAVFDVEYSDGILNITSEDGKKYVINKHSASRKIWFSSPISGADYFAYDFTKKAWLNHKNQALEDNLLNELKNNFNFSYGQK